MKRSLYEIGTQMTAIASLEDGGEIDAAADAFLASLENEEAGKLDDYVALIRTTEHERNAAKAEADMFRAVAEARDALVSRLKKRLLLHMERTGRDELATASGMRLRRQPNGGAVPVIVVPAINIEEVPDDYIVIERKLNTAIIRQRLEDGEALPMPLALHCSLGVRGNHLRIK